VDGDGPLRQSTSINNFCTKNDVRILNFFEDAITGKTEGMDRPKFSEMLSAIDEIQKGHSTDPAPTCIVIERMDRLARDLMIGEIMLGELRKRGLELYCADQGQCIDMASNDGDPTRKLIRQVLGALSEWERSMLVAKMKAAKDRIRATKGRCDGNFAFSQEDQKSVDDAIERYLELGFSERGIMFELEKAHFIPRCGRWHLATLHRLVSNVKKRPGKT
jgi:DNA invertase Pin-like site-specific DNA recombinase